MRIHEDEKIVLTDKLFSCPVITFVRCLDCARCCKMSLDLNDAAMSGNVEEVIIRLNMGEDPNQKFYPRFSTPLHDAVCCGRQDIVKVLLERGAKVNELDYKNYTPLRLAKRYGQEEIEQLLLSRGAREIVDIPRRELLPGEEDPPWVRKSSRREQNT